MGKSALLQELAAELGACGAEVINADSRQVYRGLDVGTAKPEPDLRRRVPHHLVDVAAPEAQFTAGDFVRAAERLVAEIHARGGLPVIAGGAAFYLWSFLHGLSAAPPADPEVRGELQQRARREGAAALHRELALVDADTAARLPHGDTNRVVRALEVYRLSGQPLSAYRCPRTARRDYTLLTLGLQRERPELYARIDRRVEQMFGAGLAAEVAALRARGYHAATPGLRSIGYAEFFLETEPAACCALIQRNSRRFAKRQLTFFRRFPEVRWFAADDAPGVAAALQQFFQGGTAPASAAQRRAPRSPREPTPAHP